jgi:hypothetical protein
MKLDNTGYISPLSRELAEESISNTLDTGDRSNIPSQKHELDQVSQQSMRSRQICSTGNSGRYLMNPGPESVKKGIPDIKCWYRQ